MGPVASSPDNAAMESFFALVHKNVLNRHPWASRAELQLAIITWIEKTYHRRRRQQRLDTLTPVEAEAVHQTTTKVT
ncbi:transposase [Cutibacterium avidum]|nr:transposase [Cutibacterium avidum]